MGRKTTKREKVQPDPKYNDLLVARLTRYLMKDGKLSLARRITHDAFEIIQTKTEEEPLKVFRKAMSEIMPNVEVLTRNVKGARVAFPSNVRPERQKILALRWIVEAARVNRGKKKIEESLADEIMAAQKGEGGAIKRKTNLYKSAQSHKAYSHLK